MNVLKHADRVGGWRDADERLEAVVPFFRQVTHLDRPGDHFHLKLKAEHDVQVVSRLVSFNADEGRMHFVNRPIEGVHVHVELAGEGFLGRGWVLAMSEIALSDRFGDFSFDGTDSLEMDGVLLVKSSGPPVEYRTRGETFTRIRQDPSVSEGFEATGLDGTRARYGIDANSQLRRDGATGPIYRWLLAELVDVNGNIIRFTYLHDDVGAAYPDAICYTYRESAPANCFVAQGIGVLVGSGWITAAGRR